MDRATFVNRLHKLGWEVDLELTPERLQAYSDSNDPKYWAPHVVFLHRLATKLDISKLEMDTWMFTPGQWLGDELIALGVEDDAVEQATVDLALCATNGINPYEVARGVIDSIRSTRSIPAQT